MPVCERTAPFGCRQPDRDKCPDVEGCDKAIDKANAWDAYLYKARKERRIGYPEDFDGCCENCSCAKCQATRDKDKLYDKAYDVLRKAWEKRWAARKKP